MSIERGPERYARLLLAFVFSLQACKAPLENDSVINPPPATSEFSPTVDLPKSETIIFPTPTEKLVFTPVPTEIPTSTPTATIIPTPTETPTPTPAPSPTSTPEIVEPEIILSPWEEETKRAVNELREEKGLSTLKPSPILVKVARERSRDMATKNDFSHENSEDRIIVFDLLDQTGIYYPYAGENLFRTDANDSQIEWAVQTAMDEFLKSPTHKRNLLRPEFSLIGIGYALSEEGNFKYITIIFTSLPE